MKDGKHVDEHGDSTWYQNGELHRTDGPAVIWADGSQFWYQNDKIHRTDGPATKYADGSEYWYQNGKRHRDGGPALIRADGSQYWYQNDKLHRTGGPALIRTDGSEFWYQNGERHRTGGPALIWADGTQHWYQHDKHTNEEEFNKQSTKGKVMFKSTVLEKASSIKEAIKPYEKYIVIAALLVALDHFILKGALKSKIQELGIALGNRFTAILDVAIEKIGVGDDKK